MSNVEDNQPLRSFPLSGVEELLLSGDVPAIFCNRHFVVADNSMLRRSSKMMRSKRSSRAPGASFGDALAAVATTTSFPASLSQAAASGRPSNLSTSGFGMSSLIAPMRRSIESSRKCEKTCLRNASVGSTTKTRCAANNSGSAIIRDVLPYPVGRQTIAGSSCTDSCANTACKAPSWPIRNPRFGVATCLAKLSAPRYREKKFAIPPPFAYSLNVFAKLNPTSSYEPRMLRSKAINYFLSH